MRYVEREVITKLREASQGKKMVLCLDELNRGSRSFMNFILTMLDGVEDNAYVINNHVKDEKIIIPCENLLVFATMNNGSKYTGTSVMDEALLDRFSHVRYVGYNELNEKIIIEEAFDGYVKEVSEIIQKIRSLNKTNDIRSSISTR
jgi:MoxR-like ATPase